MPVPKIAENFRGSVSKITLGATSADGGNVAVNAYVRENWSCSMKTYRKSLLTDA